MDSSRLGTLCITTALDDENVRRWGMAISIIRRKQSSTMSIYKKVWRQASGIALVAGSIVAASLVLDARGATINVAVVSASVPPGAALTRDDVKFLPVPDESTFEGLLTDTEWKSLSGLITSRPLEEGTLLNSSDFIEPTSKDDSIITLALNVGKPPWLGPGTRAQLWVAAPFSENAYSSPFVLSPEVVIDRVAIDDGFAADVKSSLVDVRIPHRDVPGAIQALANNYFLYLTPIAPLP